MARAHFVIGRNPVGIHSIGAEVTGIRSSHGNRHAAPARDCRIAHNPHTLKR
jgi:hypothetical protein